MKEKWFVFALLLVLFLISCTSCKVFASEEDYSFCDDWNEIETLLSEVDSASGSALIINALYLQNNQLSVLNTELRSVNAGLQNVIAFLLLLVGFELMRIVRSWRKGFSVK